MWLELFINLRKLLPMLYIQINQRIFASKKVVMNIRYVRCAALCVFTSFFCFVSEIHTTFTIPSSDKAVEQGKTFATPIKTTFFNKESGALTCGTDVAQTEAQALMRASAIGYYFSPFVPEKVTLNDGADALNPLFNKSIAHLTGIVQKSDILQTQVERLLVVTKQEPNVVVLIDTMKKREGDVVRSTPILHDALAKPCSEIIALAPRSGSALGAFAVVKPNEGSFGDLGSGIAYITFGEVREEKEIEKDGKKHKEMVVKGRFEQIDLGVLPEARSAMPLDCTTPVLAIEEPLSFMGEKVAMHWNRDLERLFIGLQVTAGHGATSGACALLVARVTGKAEEGIEKQWLAIEPCIPHEAIVDTTAIIGTRGSATSACIHDITTFKTSTDLWYAVVVGGNGTADETRSTVYALPISLSTENSELALKRSSDPLNRMPVEPKKVENEAIEEKPQVVVPFCKKCKRNHEPLETNNSGSNKKSNMQPAATEPAKPTEKIRQWNPEWDMYRFVGTLARADLPPITFVEGKRPAVVRAREMRAAVKESNQAFVSSQHQVRVGGGPIKGAVIEKVIAVKDAVFAVVSGSDSRAGIYHSQAILDHHGCIKNWTAWKQVHHVRGRYLQTAFYDESKGNFILLTGASPEQVDTISITLWGQGSDDGLASLVSWLRTTYTKEVGGIRAYADFPIGTVGLPRESLVVVGGHQALTVLLLATSDEHGVARYTHGEDFKHILQFSAIPSIKASEPLYGIHYTKENLVGVGTVETAAVAAHQDQAWLFIGGAGGLYVCVGQDGKGLDAQEGVGSSLVGLKNKTFVPVGSYRFVRRLLYDNGYLYVLTDTGFDRINLAQSTFGSNGTCVATTLATRSMTMRDHLQGIFTDVIVSDKVAFLGTSRGLYRVGDGCDIRTATCESDLSWMPMNDARDYDDPIINLKAISATGNVTDVARAGGGNLYVTQGYLGRDRSVLKRFSVADVSANPIDNATVRAIPDIRIEGAPNVFRRIGTFTNCCVTDGALWLHIDTNNQEKISTMRAMPTHMPRNDTALSFSHTPPAQLLFADRSASHGAWWALGETVVVNE